MSDVLNEERENQPNDGEGSQLRIVVRSSVRNEREQRIDSTLDSHVAWTGEGGNQFLSGHRLKRNLYVEAFQECAYM